MIEPIKDYTDEFGDKIISEGSPLKDFEFTDNLSFDKKYENVPLKKLAGNDGVLKSTRYAPGETGWSLGSEGVIRSISSIPLNISMSTCFENTGRFQITTTGSGVNTFSNSGASFGPTALGIGSTKIIWYIGENLNGTFTFSTSIIANSDLANSGSMFIGFGPIDVTSTGHDFTQDHIGFKILMTATEKTLYATQAKSPGGSETSLALTTITGGDNVDLLFHVNGSVSVDYYYRKYTGISVGILTKTTLINNLPTSGLSRVQFSSSNDNTSTANNLQVLYAKVDR